MINCIRPCFWPINDHKLELPYGFEEIMTYQEVKKYQIIIGLKDFPAPFFTKTGCKFGTTFWSAVKNL